MDLRTLVSFLHAAILPVHVAVAIAIIYRTQINKSSNPPEALSLSPPPLRGIYVKTASAHSLALFSPLPLCLVLSSVLFGCDAMSLVGFEGTRSSSVLSAFDVKKPITNVVQLILEFGSRNSICREWYGKSWCWCCCCC